MDKYKVKLNPQAFREIDDIFAYNRFGKIIAGKGYRQLLIDNYIAIFKIDEASKTVNVVTVQYQGRNI